MNPDRTFAASEARFLTDLAAGKYDAEVAQVRACIRAAVPMVPVLANVEFVLDLFLKLNRLTAPRGPVTSDGAGGFVPESNSRYDPATGRFI
ncbi:MAG: hypothetical protein PHS14_21110 [Elusimicrobia bacterium]|nr:hypothetical protein [Elusimicrobiota bacterium]